jgi:hypothetical protein
VPGIAPVLKESQGEYIARTTDRQELHVLRGNLAKLVSGH